jgi:hypothetical protein
MVRINIVIAALQGAMLRPDTDKAASLIEAHSLVIVLSHDTLYLLQSLHLPCPCQGCG